MRSQELSPIKLDLESEKKISTLQKVGVALAGVGIAGAGFFGLKALGGESPNTEPKIELVASAPVNAGEDYLR